MNNYSQPSTGIALGMAPQVMPQNRMMTGSEVQSNTNSGMAMVAIPSGFDPNLMMQMVNQMVNMGMMGNVGQMGNAGPVGMNQHPPASTTGFGNLGTNEQQPGYMGTNQQQQVGNSAGFSDTGMNPVSPMGFGNVGANQVPSNSMEFHNMGMNQAPSNSVGFGSALMNQLPSNSMEFSNAAIVSQTVVPAADAMQSGTAGYMPNSQMSNTQGNFSNIQAMMPGNTFHTSNISSGSTSPMDFLPTNFAGNQHRGSVSLDRTGMQPMHPAGQPPVQRVRHIGPSSMNIRRPIRPVGSRPMRPSRSIRPFRPRPPGIGPAIRPLMTFSTQRPPLSRMQYASPTVSMSRGSENEGSLETKPSSILMDSHDDVPADETNHSPANAKKKRKLNELKVLPISMTLTPGENVIPPPPPGTEAELNNEDFVSETKIDGSDLSFTTEGTKDQDALGVEESDQERVKKKQKKKNPTQTGAENADSLFCPVCNVKCNTVQNFAQHMQGNKHKAKLAEVSDKCAKMAEMLKEKAQAGNSSDKDDVTKEAISSSTIQVSIRNENASAQTFSKCPLLCKVCQVQFTEPLLEHRRSVEHKQKKKEQRPYCRQCSMWFNSPKKFVEHSNSERHKINYDDWLRRQKTSCVTSTDVDDYIEEYPENMDDFVVIDATGIYRNQTIDSPTPAVQTYPVINEFDPNTPVGQDFVIPVSGYFCKICHKFYNTEHSGRVVHCQSKSHYDKFKEKMNNTTRKNVAESATKPKHVSEDHIDIPSKLGLTESTDVADQQLVSSGVDTPNEISAKMFSKPQNVAQTTVLQVKAEKQVKENESTKSCTALTEPTIESGKTSIDIIDIPSALTLTESAVMPTGVADQKLMLSNADTPNENNVEMTKELQYIVQPTVFDVKTKSSYNWEIEHVNENVLAQPCTDLDKDNDKKSEANVALVDASVSYD